MIGCRVLVAVFLLTTFSGVEAKGLRLGPLGKLGQGIRNTAMIITATSALCLGTMGCDQQLQIIVPLAQNLSEVGESGTKPVRVFLFGEEYDGVVGIAENGQMMAEINGASGLLTFLNQDDDFIGFVVPGHANLDREVEIPGMIGDRTTTRHGTITKVFDNGFYQITVTQEMYDDDGSEVMPFAEYDIIAYELLTHEGHEHGGFTFMDDPHDPHEGHEHGDFTFMDEQE